LTPKIKRRKSVRFSPTVEKNTFLQSEPPSPEHAANVTTTIEEEPLVIQDQEHIQLTLEEAFFLSYALGALNILDPETRSPISTKDLFSLCRRTSYFPPQANPALAPDDPFMVNYVVYHHFRSLGWVPRSGIKFSVDYMLYMRGPVFTHAEFAVLILPSYSDPYWSSNPFLRNYVKGKQERTWAWMSCINRVITQVRKTLILAYVDIPRPLEAEEEPKMGIDAILKRYSIREVVMKRWSSSRMRD
jgi:tRNA-splicing endonuclease subunit Sen2